MPVGTRAKGKTPNPFLTSSERIAINLIFEWLGEQLYNRSLSEYIAIRNRLPKLDALVAYVNQRLREIAASGREPYKICYRKAGDQGIIRYEDFPRSLSREVVRTAVRKFWPPDLDLLASS